MVSKFYSIIFQGSFSYSKMPKIRCTPLSTLDSQKTIHKSIWYHSKVITSENHLDTSGHGTMGIAPSVGDFLQRVDDDGLARLVEEVRAVFFSLSARRSLWRPVIVCWAVAVTVASTSWHHPWACRRTDWTRSA